MLEFSACREQSQPAGKQAEVGHERKGIQFFTIFSASEPENPEIPIAKSSYPSVSQGNGLSCCNFAAIAPQELDVVRQARKDDAFFCMGLDKPLHVPRGTAKAMVTQLQFRDATLTDKHVRSCCSVA